MENNLIVRLVERVRHSLDSFLPSHIWEKFAKAFLGFATDDVIEIRRRQERLRYRRSMRTTDNHRNVKPFLPARGDFEDLTVVGCKERRDTDDIGPNLG